MYRLYDFLPSGNSYKVRLLLNLLEIPFERIDVDILNRETRTPEFLQQNPNGKIPLLEIAPGKFLAESNAILYYLSQGTNFFPADNYAQALVMQWLFFEQYSHEPNIATPRYWISILQQPDRNPEQLKQKQKLGYAALNVMEQHLSDRSFFVAETYTIADIGLYAYTHVAEEGGFDLQRFPAILAWFKRLEAHPKHIQIERS
ncbi:glutathione S-transferase family protein [Pleurocapsales cyanobacterium LEGE 10410]|nr:glutathione S-transferase family protein [Pleurocapsales cyanobacterium LEGE 10410]